MAKPQFVLVYQSIGVLNQGHIMYLMTPNDLDDPDDPGWPKTL